jgi:hypothetical protein
MINRLYDIITEPDEIGNITERLSASGTYTASWLRQISEYLLEEREARILCRELAKRNLVTID